MRASFPFGRPATRRPPRRPAGDAALFVLGVYPSALHVRWRRPDAVTIGALAVDDEPTVFWDGADATSRIERWRAAVGWRDAWGLIGEAGGNGSSGRAVVRDVLAPLGVAAEDTYFTDCLPYCFVKSGSGSQSQRIAEVYTPFAAAQGLPPTVLPDRPRPRELVARTVAEERPTLLAQLHEAGATRVVTLGQEAADAFAAITATERILLRPDETYGRSYLLSVDRRHFDWLPLTHPGNRTPAWRTHHEQWAANR